MRGTGNVKETSATDGAMGRGGTIIFLKPILVFLCVFPCAGRSPSPPSPHPCSEQHPRQRGTAAFWAPLCSLQMRFLPKSGSSLLLLPPPTGAYRTRGESAAVSPRIEWVPACPQRTPVGARSEASTGADGDPKDGDIGAVLSPSRLSWPWSLNRNDVEV